MKEKEFNLLREPWILVMGTDGNTEELSILETFRRAAEFKSLAGELPTQDVAVLRLLLAILHTVFGRYNLSGEYAPICDEAEFPLSPGEVLDRWKSLWNMGKFPMEIIEKYLETYEDRFYLFHPKRPFYQVAELDRATDYTAAKLNGELSESNNKVRLFSQRSGSVKEKLDYSEAARWLLYVNAFDDTSAKPKEKGLPSPGAGWLGKLGLVTAQGENLFETLLLNLVLLKSGGKELWGKENPVWEEDTVKTCERTEITMPDNLSELLSLQSRRLFLKRQGDSVVGYSLLGGDFFQKENALSEQMTVWRNDAKKETDPPKYNPRRHHSDRRLWRNFSSLAVQSGSNPRPGVINWLAELKSDSLISNKHFHFQTAAVKYGDKDFFIDDLFSDSLSFNAGLLTDLGADWVSRITAEIETTELLVSQVGYLAEELSKAAGSADGAAQKEKAKEQAYFRLDEPFRGWLESIDPEKDEMSAAFEIWWRQEKQIIYGLGKELIEQSGPRAFTGREIKEKTKGKEVPRYCSAPKAFNTFLARTSNRQALKGGKQQ